MMNEFILLDGKLLKREEAGLPMLSSAALYGEGVFTTLAFYRGKPFLFEKHWKRLTANAGQLGIKTAGLDEASLLEMLCRLAAANGLADGRIRATLFEASAPRIWGGAGRKSSLLLAADAFRPLPAILRAAISPYPINSASPFAGIKSCNYLENLFAFNEAAAKGFDEAIRLNEKGSVASASMANIFWIKGGKIFTPSLKTGCLPGTMREFILENFSVCECECGIDELEGAGLTFLASSGLGIRQALLSGGEGHSELFDDILACFERAIKM